MTLVVFDIDGTLTNTKTIDDFCFIESIRECWNCDLGVVDWNSYVNVTDAGLSKDIYKSFFNKEINDTELKNLKNLFFEKIFYSAKEKPQEFLEIKGAKDFVKELQNQNINVSIATGGWKQTAEIKLKQIGIELEAFPYATSDDHYSRREILNNSINKSKEFYCTNFNRIIYIGDGIWDYKTSSELNIDFIGIDYLQNGKLKECGVQTVFKDYSDIEIIMNEVRMKNGM